MANAKLNATLREEGKNPRQIRKEGFLPGSIYGKNIEPKNIQISTHEFELANRNNEEGTWEINLGGEKINAKIQELQMNFSTSELLNVEFAVI